MVAYLFHFAIIWPNVRPGEAVMVQRCWCCSDGAAVMVMQCDPWTCTHCARRALDGGSIFTELGEGRTVAYRRAFFVIPCYKTWMARVAVSD